MGRWSDADRVATQSRLCELLGVEPIELPGGHCPHVNRPDVPADALVRIDNL
jgi:hypothetical protein